MFDLLFPKHWSTLKRLIWLKAAALSSAVVKTVTAAIVHIKDALAGPAQNVTIAIQPVQAGSGDPSPDNVRPISGWTGANVYNDPAHGGLIWWNQTVYDVLITAGGTTTISDGIVSVHPTGSSNRLRALSTAVIAGHKYFEAVTIKSDGEHSVGFQNYLFPGTLKTASASWTVLEDIQTAASTGNPYVQLYSVSNTDYQIKQGSFMFFDLTEMFGAGKEPATVQEFRALFPKESYAYNEGEPMTVSAVNGDPYTLIPISWEEEAGTVYGGTLDVTTGELTADAVSATVNPADIAQSVSIYYVGTKSLPMKVGNGLPGICDRFPTVATSDHFGVRFGANNRIIYFYKLENLGIGTIEEARAWFTANPTTVVYPLATPVTCQLTPQEVQLLAGENNIWADCGPTTLTYLADGRASDVEALGILLAGRYVNTGAADEATDAEALDILLGGTK